jgi:hypothetical protein
MNALLTKGQKHMKEALKYLQAGAIVPVDMETTILLVNALKEALAQPAQEPRNFCQRCGKRTPDLTTIHTCTPPRGLEMT